MKFALGIACLMTVALVQGIPHPGPPVLDQSELAPWCRLPPCPESTKQTVRLPHRMDCLQYVECTAGVRTIKACPPDQHFNEDEQTCMDPKIANCVPCWQKTPPK